MSTDELRLALRDSLDRTGALKSLKANIRASIYQALNGEVGNHDMHSIYKVLYTAHADSWNHASAMC